MPYISNIAPGSAGSIVPDAPILKTVSEVMSQPDPLTMVASQPEPAPVVGDLQLAPDAAMASEAISPSLDLSNLNQPEAPSTIPLQGEYQWEVDDREYQAQKAEVSQRNMEKFKSMVRDPDTFFKGKDLGFARDRETAMKQFIAESYMEMRNGWNPLPPGDLNRKLLRLELAQTDFEGRGAESDDAFHKEIFNSVKDEDDQVALFIDLKKEAASKEFQRRLDLPSPPDLQNGYVQWRGINQGKPGYKADREPEYYAQWTDAQSTINRQIHQFRPQLDSVWSAFTQEGDIGSAAQNAYLELPDNQRQAFLSALSIRAKSLPKEEQAAFWSNLTKQSGRDIGGLARSLGDGAVNYMMQEMTDEVRHTTKVQRAIGPLGMQVSAAEENSINNFNTESTAKARKLMDFASDVRVVQQADYDPIKYLSDDSNDIFSVRTLEKGVYGMPGAVASSAMAAIPTVGMTAFYLSSQESVYQDYRQKFQAAGMSYDDAAAKANLLAPIAAVPQVLLEKLQLEAFAGKLPFFERAMVAVSDKISLKSGQFTARALAGSMQEGFLEQVQNIVPDAVQDLAHGLEMDVPDVEWSNGKTGVLDGFWAQSASMMVTMLPLAIFGAGAGVIRDQARLDAYRNASDTELQAIGHSPEDVTSIRSSIARGDRSGIDAIDAAYKTLNPRSEMAKAASATLLDDKLKAAVKSLMIAGSIPGFRQEESGKTWTIYDQKSGEPLATGQTLNGAREFAETHIIAVQEAKAQTIANLIDQMGAAEFTADRNTDSRQSLQDITPFNSPELSQEDMQSVADQTEAMEVMNGGDGSVAQMIFGQSKTDRTQLAQGMRSTVNRIFKGSSVLTVFHEDAHGWRTEAYARGIMTREKEIAMYRSLDQVLALRTTKEGKSLRLLPEDESKITDKLLGEAFSEIMEAEIIRTRKGAGVRKLPPGLISRNLSMLAKINPEAARNIRAFVEAIRAFFGLAVSRAYALKIGIREGTIDKAEYESFMSTMLGLSEQDELEQQSAKSLSEILGDDMPAYQMEDGDPFSLGSSKLADALISTQDKDYLAAIESGDMTSAQNMVDEAAKKAGFTQRAYHQTSRASADSLLGGRPFTLAKGRARLSDDRVPDGFFFKPTDSDINLTKGESVQLGVFLKMDNPYDVETATQLTREFGERGKSLREAIQKANAFDKENVAENERILQKYNTIVSRAERRVVMAEEESQVNKWRRGERRMAREVRQELLRLLKQDAHDSVIIENDQGTGGRITKTFIVFDPSQVKSADPVTYDSAGNIVPLSQRFNPADDRISYSIGNAALARALHDDALSRIKNPVRLAQAMAKVARALEDLQLQADRLDLLAGTKRMQKSLAREAATREALMVEELENQAYARHWGILSNDDLVKIKEQPAHSLLADPTTPLRGRLMSKAAAIKKDPDLFQVHRPGDYDGADGISRSVFGGTLMPDQAAQELYDAGIIKSPTPDALWDKLRQEQSGVAAMKELVVKAQEDIRAARKQAKEETNAWLAAQQSLHSSASELAPANLSTKQEIIQVLSMLDAILMALPPELRGKIGGYTQLARLGSNEARLAYLKTKLAKAHTVLEGWLREQYDIQMKAILKRATPDKSAAGEKPRGKVGADLHQIFQAVDAAMYMPIHEVEAEALALDSIAASDADTVSDTERDNATMQANLIRLAGDWGKADAARREAAVLEAQRVFERGYYDYKFLQSAKREKRGIFRLALENGISKKGTRMEREEKAQADATFLGALKKGVYGLYSYEQVVHAVFGQDSKEALLIADWERHASYAYTDAVGDKMDQIDALFENLSGNQLKGEELRYAMAQKSIDVDGETFSQFEAITATLMWRQQDGQRHMLGHQDDSGNYTGKWHYDQAFVDKLEDQLTQEAKMLRYHLMEQYAAEYDRLNAIYRELYGVALPKHKFYSPLTVKPQTAAAGQVTDPVSGFAIAGGNGLTPGSLRTRSQNAIAEPEFRDALQTYIAHSKQMEHWMAYAPFATESMALINNRDLGNAVEASSGKEALSILRAWNDYFAAGGIRDASAQIALNKGISKLTSRAAQMAIVGRVSVVAVQSVQLGAALAEMPALDYLTRFAKLTTGNLDWSGALQSDYIKRRLREMPPVVRQAMEGLSSTSPTKLKYLVRKIGETVSGADALFTAGTYAMIYDFQLSQAKGMGLSGQQATDYAHNAAERSTDRVAQPVRPGARSFVEVSTASNAYSRILWSFASDARQKLALSAYAIAHRSPAEAARALAVTWLVGGVFATLIRSVIRDLKSDDDNEVFDSKNWDPKRLALSALTGPLGGIPVLGDELEKLIAKAFGEYMPNSGLLSAASNAVPALGRVPDWFTGQRDMAGAFKDAEAILSGAGMFSDEAAAAASLSHIARDLFGVVDNFTGD